MALFSRVYGTFFYVGFEKSVENFARKAFIGKNLEKCKFLTKHSDLESKIFGKNRFLTEALYKKYKNSAKLQFANILVVKYNNHTF